MPGGSTHHQQSIWLEKVGKAVSLTYHDNIKRIYRKIAKKCPNVSLVSEASGASLTEQPGHCI